MVVLMPFERLGFVLIMYVCVLDPPRPLFSKNLPFYQILFFLCT